LLKAVLASDSPTVSEAVIRAVNKTSAVTESLTLAESLSRTVVFARAVTDHVSLTEIVTSSGGGGGAVGVFVDTVFVSPWVEEVF
jgi:hypothetical protein